MEGQAGLCMGWCMYVWGCMDVWGCMGDGDVGDVVGEV